MNRNERSLSSYQMYGPAKPPLRFGPFADAKSGVTSTRVFASRR